MIEEQRVKIMKEALERAEEWFRKFGFNSVGIAVKDDFEDPGEIHHCIKNALSSLDQNEK